MVKSEERLIAYIDRKVEAKFPNCRTDLCVCRDMRVCMSFVLLYYLYHVGNSNPNLTLFWCCMHSGLKHVTKFTEQTMRTEIVISSNLQGGGGGGGVAARFFPAKS